MGEIGEGAVNALEVTGEKVVATKSGGGRYQSHVADISHFLGNIDTSAVQIEFRRDTSSF